MNTFNKPICIIPAKAASKRLKKKNILKLCGKSVINYVIEAAIESNLFSKIIVSTESDEVKNSILNKKIIIHKRENYLAHDPYGVVDVVLDVINNNSSYKNYNDLCILLPTSPLIESIDIKNVYDYFNSHDFNAVFTLSKNSHSAFRAVTIKGGKIEPIFKNKILKKSQELESTYNINAAIIMLNMEIFLKEKNYFIYPIGAFTLEEEKAVDIDTSFDFEFATFLMQKRLSK